MIKMVDRYVARPYVRRTPEQLLQLAQDHVDEKIVSSEGMQDGIIAITFPGLGQTMQLVKAAADPKAYNDLLKTTKDPELFKAAVADAQTMFKEFADNKAAMFFQYKEKQVNAELRQAMLANIPAEHKKLLEERPMFTAFQYLDEEDTNRFCDYRDELLIRKTEKELGVEPGSIPFLTDGTSTKKPN